MGRGAASARLTREGEEGLVQDRPSAARLEREPETAGGGADHARQRRAKTAPGGEKDVCVVKT